MGGAPGGPPILEAGTYDARLRIDRILECGTVEVRRVPPDSGTLCGGTHCVEKSRSGESGTRRILLS